MREWLKNLACKAATEIAAECRQIGAHGSHRPRQICLTKMPLLCISGGGMTIRSLRTLILKVNLKTFNLKKINLSSKGRCKSFPIRKGHAR